VIRPASHPVIHPRVACQHGSTQITLFGAALTAPWQTGTSEHIGGSARAY
jgi:hypothetical protein